MTMSLNRKRDDYISPLSRRERRKRLKSWLILFLSPGSFYVSFYDTDNDDCDPTFYVVTSTPVRPNDYGTKTQSGWTDQGQRRLSTTMTPVYFPFFTTEVLPLFSDSVPRNKKGRV